MSSRVEGNAANASILMQSRMGAVVYHSDAAAGVTEAGRVMARTIRIVREPGRGTAARGAVAKCDVSTPRQVFEDFGALAK